MEFNMPHDLQAYIGEFDGFIHDEILPLQHKNDNGRFFDHRRKPSRTQWDNRGLPTKEWEDLAQARDLADKAGFYRFPMPKQFDGAGHPNLNLWMCVIRYHLASHPIYGGGVSLANNLQNEHGVVGNFPDVLMLYHFGSKQQQQEFIPARLRGDFRTTFGLTEASHGSDATHVDTTAAAMSLPDGRLGYSINGNRKWQTGMHSATHMIVFARTSGNSGSAKGITAFIVPVDAPGLKVISFEYTLNMPTDHVLVELKDVRVPETALLGPGGNGLVIAQTFTHENRIRQASSSCGAAAFCVAKSIEYARKRVVFGKPLASNQVVQWPLVELSTRIEMLRLLILRTANEMDQVQQRSQSSNVPPWIAIEKQLGHKISMCNHYANRLATQAADNAIQVHGGLGYSHHMPFEHIWRHFRRYRITEGSEEIQIRKVAGYLFGYKSADQENEGDDGQKAKEEKERARSGKL